MEFVWRRAVVRRRRHTWPVLRIDLCLKCSIIIDDLPGELSPARVPDLSYLVDLVHELLSFDCLVEAAAVFVDRGVHVCGIFTKFSMPGVSASIKFDGRAFRKFVDEPHHLRREAVERLSIVETLFGALDPRLDALTARLYLRARPRPDRLNVVEVSVVHHRRLFLTGNRQEDVRLCPVGSLCRAVRGDAKNGLPLLTKSNELIKFQGRCGEVRLRVFLGLLFIPRASGHRSLKELLLCDLLER